MLETNKKAFEEFEAYEDFSDLKTDQLLTEIWLKPKSVFSYLMTHEPRKYVQPLLWVSAFASAFNKALEKDISFNSYGFGYLMGGIIGGTVITYLLYYVFAWFLKLFGNAFLGGKATASDYRTVVAWANIPLILTVVVTFLLVVIYGGNALGSFEPEGYASGVVFIIAGLLDIGLAIWSIVIMVTGIMHIQKFGLWKAIGNIFLPLIILVLIFVVIFNVGDLINALN